MRIPTALRRIAANSLCHPCVGLALATIFRDIIPNKGLWIDTSHPSITPRTKAALFWGRYEAAEIRFARRYLWPELDVVELGCSIGVLSCHIRRQTHRSRHLLCVEAVPDFADIARKNLSINCCQHNVTIIQRAIDYDKQRRCILFELGDNSTGGRIVETLGSNGRRTIEIQTTTLSELLREAGIGDYCLVSDIEGAEAGFVMGEADDLSKCARIIIELHSTFYRHNPVTADDMVHRLVRNHEFDLTDQYGRCYVFTRRRSHKAVLPPACA